METKLSIGEKWKQHIKPWEAINKRIVKLAVEIRGKSIIYIRKIYTKLQCPYCKQDELMLEDQLDQILDLEEVILIGACNARVGQQNDNKVIGHYCEPQLMTMVKG